MSVQTITAAQRLAIRDNCLKVLAQAQHWANSSATPSDARTAMVTPLLDALAAALGLSGSTGLAATQAIVANAQALVVKNSAGTTSTNGTAAVASGALTGVALPANNAIITSGTKFNPASVTGVGSYLTPTIVNGVITSLVLSMT